MHVVRSVRFYNSMFSLGRDLEAKEGGLRRPDVGGQGVISVSGSHREHLSCLYIQ